ncbi:aminotransferase class V-fold PLP-dependent enzyme [Piscinibacter sakaiensis]|uniref:aminotransferase class V-fold PLP-dependent enzyme n=1 Tax=Piscinibacter sakaiensis TaxID=1547922 RepID=UPI003AAA92EF
MERNPVLFLGRRSAELLRESREALGRLVGARADDLVYVPNATTGVNIVAASLDLQPVDEVLVNDLEYGACLATWTRICEQRGATLRKLHVPLPFDADRFADEMLAAIGPRTRLLFVSHIASTTALRLPVERLIAAARARGVLTLVDGAHAPGQIDLDLDALGADFYTGNCHKWLCGPKSAGFLHARSELQPMLHASVTSWGYLGGEGGHTGFEGYTGSSLFERRLQWQGTRDISACLAVPAAIDWLAEHDWPTHRIRCHEQAVALMHRVCAANGLQPIAADDDFAQMVAIPVPHRDAPRLRQRLYDEHQIEVPVTQHDGQVLVRVSVQAYNSEAELAALEEALRH